MNLSSQNICLPPPFPSQSCLSCRTSAEEQSTTAPGREEMQSAMGNVVLPLQTLKTSQWDYNIVISNGN